MTEKGKLILISAPSGGGKNAVIRALVQRLPNSTQLVTTTTRQPRPGETPDKDYHYISREEFERRIKAGDFLEHNDYAGNYYGTERAELERALNQFAVVFSQAEVNGKRGLDQQGIPHLSIFLLPESLKILEKRIKRRGGITAEYIKKRLEIAKREIEEAKNYDYALVNREGQITTTIAEAEKAARDYLSA